MENSSVSCNFEEYDDPALYDQENDIYKGDIPFLLKWASLTKGIIIDIACGTGRATIPLARKGYNLVGVDVHNGMLDEAKNKSSNLKLEIEWVQQDCTSLSLNTKSNLIYTVGNSFQHFLTNESQDGIIGSVSKHLHKDGIFIFGTRFPSAEELLSPAKEEYWKTYTETNTQLKVDVYLISTYDSLNQIQHNTTVRKYINACGEVVDERKTNISLRYVFPKEMERLLTKHGLKILNVYRDWNETPITNDSYEMVYVCQNINKY